MEYENRYQKFAQLSSYDCLLFDVDDTLYPLTSGLSNQCTNNIEEYMVQRLGIEENKVPEMNQMLYKNYGTTMAGLRAIGYNFDHDDYHSFVHGRLPYEVLKPDHVLRSLLLSLPIRKVIFSNADKNHVARVLSKLGLEDCFDQIICFETLNSSDTNNTSDDVQHPYDVYNCGSESELPATPIVCKPFEVAFEQAFKKANIDPQKTLFFDDSIRNIQSGKRMGLHTVLVGNWNRSKGADYALESIHNMREAFPELWEVNGDKDQNEMFSGEVAIQTSVLA